MKVHFQENFTKWSGVIYEYYLPKKKTRNFLLSIVKFAFAIRKEINLRINSILFRIGFQKWIAVIFITVQISVNSASAQFKSDSTAVHNTNQRALAIYLHSPDSSIVLANNAIKRATEQKIAYEKAFGFYILSKAHWVKANYRLSMEYGFVALKAFENTLNRVEWVKSLLSLSRTLIDLHNYTMARSFLMKATALAVEAKDSNLLADTYREFSLLLSNLHQYDSALVLADKAIMIYNEEKDTLSASILYGRKARIYFELKDYKKSAFQNKRSLLYDSLVNNRRGLGISYLQSAQIANKLNLPDSAIYFLKRAIHIHNEIGNIGSLITSHALLADIYARQGKSVFAAAELKLVSELKDTLYNFEKSGQIQEMQSLYELESKNKTIRLLEQESQLSQQRQTNERLILIFLLVCIAFLSTLIVVLWRFRTTQAKANTSLAATNKAIEQQKEEIEVQAESLHHLNQLKSKLFSVISHDLRGPLSNLLSLLELFSRKIMSQEEFIAAAEKLKANLHVTQRTLENLLHWSLSQMEGIKTEFRLIEINSLMNDVKTLLEETAKEKNVQIEISSNEKLNVNADPDQIHLVLRNLIHNAIKFSQPQGRVVLAAVMQNNHCHVSITDFGIGMTEDEIAMITKTDTHFSKIGTKQEKGTGLGLVLCKEFIQRHGGTLSIRSTVGRTTEISFTLPLFPN